MSKIKPLERDENLHQMFDRLPVEDLVPTFKMLLQRGEPGSTVKSTEKHALSNLSCPKRVEKTVSKSQDFLVTESVEV